MPLPAIPAPTNLATLTGWVKVGANADGVIIPANCVLLYAVLAELNGHAINLSIGTTAGGSDVLGTQAVLAGGLLLVPATSFSLIWFSRIAIQKLWLNSASWPAGSLVSAQLVYQPGP
jgi:hypothetical protein